MWWPVPRRSAVWQMVSPSRRKTASWVRLCSAWVAGEKKEVGQREERSLSFESSVVPPAGLRSSVERRSESESASRSSGGTSAVRRAAPSAARGAGRALIRRSGRRGRSATVRSHLSWEDRRRQRQRRTRPSPLRPSQLLLPREKRRTSAAACCVISRSQPRSQKRLW